MEANTRVIGRLLSTPSGPTETVVKTRRQMQRAPLVRAAERFDDRFQIDQALNIPCNLLLRDVRTVALNLELASLH